MATIFTRIINGEIPATKVYEDADTLAFLDIAPASRGHTLVICKAEVATLAELSDAQLIATARTTQRVAAAVQRALHPDGINIMQNNGAAAGQTDPARCPDRQNRIAPTRARSAARARRRGLPGQSRNETQRHTQRTDGSHPKTHRQTSRRLEGQA